MKKILFINHKFEKCGVYQYGLRVFNIIKTLKDFQFSYEECENQEQCSRAIKSNSFWAIIYNYHQHTLSFVDPTFIHEHQGPIHICLCHELSQEIADQLDGSFFHYYLYGNPSFVERNPRIFKLNRIIPDCKETFPLPKIPTIGSFGFGGVLVKQFDRIVQVVEKEMDEAIIRINIPVNDAIDPDGKQAKECAKKCEEKCTKPGIKLQISHEFFNEENLLKFLAQNTINVFFYEERAWPGISSAVDFALASKRPLAVSDSSLFEHLLFIKPSIVIKNNSMTDLLKKMYRFVMSCFDKKIYFNKYKPSLRFLFRSFFKNFRKKMAYASLTEIIKNGTKPLEPLYSAWSEESFSKNFQEILERIERLENTKNEDSFNRLLDDSARLKYETAIQDLVRLAPKIMKRKIHRANVQQAFVFDTVQKLSSPKSKILCVGGYHDTAYLGLKKLGYQITNIDPRINCDLNTFFLHPKTKKNSYDLIFSTSVIEHVEDDRLFFSQMEQLLNIGGIGVITCDFKNDYQLKDALFPGNFRFYTEADLENRILPLLKNCCLLGKSKWDCGEHDFEYENQKYTFATLVFQKTDSSKPIAYSPSCSVS